MTPEEQRLLAEIAALRADVRRLHRPVVRHSWLKLFVHDLEYNPKTQFAIHQYAAYFWVFNAVCVTLALIFLPDQWNLIAVFYVALVSLYANFATDYGAMSAALAADNQPPLPTIPMEVVIPPNENPDGSPRRIVGDG